MGTKYRQKREDIIMQHNYMGLDQTQLDAWSEAFHASRADRIASNASVRSGLIEASIDHEAVQKLPYTFSIDLKQGSITDQKSSGRCWLFSALNTFRYEVITRYHLEDFELSQNYLFFYDKLERSNYYLENMLELLDEPTDGRLFAFLNGDPLGDGGQWDMMANIVRKYGVVPKNIYPDGANATVSRHFNRYLTSFLRETTAMFRKAHMEGRSMTELQQMKNERMKDVYRILCIALGEPPRTFDLTLTDKDGKVIQDFGINGRVFFDKYVGLPLDDYVSLIHAPTQDKPFGRTYTIRYLGNVAEGAPVRYLNLDMQEIKAAVIAQLSDGHPVWFGSDCAQFSARPLGILDRASTNVEQLLGIHYEFTKADRLTYGDSAMNHAMVFLGVNLNAQGQPDRWRIENSWGKEAGVHDGYFIASDSWFDDFVYQVVVNRKYLKPETAALYKQPMTELEPWDPMGTLARTTR